MVTKETVKTVFTNVARNYDRMNDLMSAGIHRLWKDYFVRHLPINRDSRVLDVAGGTGDIAFRIVDQLAHKPRGTGSVTVLDINQKMIDVGEDRADKQLLNANARKQLSWMCADAENLPFEAATFNIYTIAFGIRNCTDRNKVLSEAFRVLRPGGTFACLEFSRVECNPLRQLYDAYSFQFIPVLGQLVAGDFKSYRYLVDSIRTFPDQHSFGEEILNAGFSDVAYENLTFGVCAIHTAKKITP